MDYEKLWNSLKEFIDNKQLKYARSIFNCSDKNVIDCTIANTSYNNFHEIFTKMHNLEIDEERRKCND